MLSERSQTGECFMTPFYKIMVDAQQYKMKVDQWRPLQGRGCEAPGGGYYKGSER